jgi:hypothetical protein
MTTVTCAVHGWRQMGCIHAASSLIVSVYTDDRHTFGSDLFLPLTSAEDRDNPVAGGGQAVVGWLSRCLLHLGLRRKTWERSKIPPHSVRLVYMYIKTLSIYHGGLFLLRFDTWIHYLAVKDTHPHKHDSVDICLLIRTW